MDKSNGVAGAVTTATCLFCGVEFKPVSRGLYKGKPRYSKYCSGECYQRHQNRKPAVMAICKGCDKEFRARRDRTTYCSRECSFQSKQRRCPICNHSLRGSYEQGFHVTYCSAECKQRAIEIAKNHLCICIVCGVGFRGRLTAKHCGADECRKEMARRSYRRGYAARYVKQSRNCLECGDDFEISYELEGPPSGYKYRGNSRRRFCSKKCQHRYINRVARSTRRARIRGAIEYESFDPLEVLQRDKWRCQWCKTRTPKRLRGTLDDRAPELDHIIPLARGGVHTRANTQCLCRKCNQEKSADTQGQLRLALEV